MLKTKLTPKIIPASVLNKIASDVLEKESKNVFNDIIVFVLDKCMKDAKRGCFESEFDIKEYDSSTFKSYFEKVTLSYIYKDIEKELTSNGYKTELISNDKFVVRW